MCPLATSPAHPSVAGQVYRQLADQGALLPRGQLRPAFASVRSNTRSHAKQIWTFDEGTLAILNCRHQFLPGQVCLLQSRQACTVMGTKGITLYTAGTPNGWKANVIVEELQIPYKLHALSLSKNEQKQDWYLKINPNGRIPAIGEQAMPVVTLCFHAYPDALQPHWQTISGQLDTRMQ